MSVREASGPATIRGLSGTGSRASMVQGDLCGGSQHQHESAFISFQSLKILIKEKNYGLFSRVLENKD